MIPQPSHPKKERTFVIIKPDGVQRSLIGEVISRFERAGLKLAAMKFIAATDKQCWDHYAKDDVWFLKKGTNIVENRTKLGLPIEMEAIDYGKAIIGNVVKFITSGPIVAMVWEGNSAISVVKKLTGGTEPSTSPVGTIRGDFGVESYFLCDTDGGRGLRNILHCTDGDQAEADREINIWFAPNEIITYRLVQDEILYDVNLDGILE